jgi:hypothetical protein
MTKTFCDRCGLETTNNQFHVAHPDIYAGRGGKVLELDVCDGCQKKAVALFNKLFNRKTTADFAKAR